MDALTASPVYVKQFGPVRSTLQDVWFWRVLLGSPDTSPVGADLPICHFSRTLEKCHYRTVRESPLGNRGAMKSLELVRFSTPGSKSLSCAGEGGVRGRSIQSMRQELSHEVCSIRGLLASKK